MRLADVHPLCLPLCAWPYAASDLRCPGGHHAACSIARTYETLDRAGRSGGAGGPGRVWGFTRAARAGGLVVTAGRAAGVVWQLGGSQPGRQHAQLRAPHCRGGHPGRRDGRAVGKLALLDLHRRRGGGRASGRRQLERAGLAGGSWQTAAPLPSGSSGGLVVADPAGTFVYADTTGNAFTFTSGASSFGAGSGSHSSLADLKIVPGHAVMLATDAVSTEPVS